MGGNTFYPFSGIVFFIDIAGAIAISIFCYLRWRKEASLLLTSISAAVIVEFLNFQVIHRIMFGRPGYFSIFNCIVMFVLFLGVAGIVFFISDSVEKLLIKHRRNS